MIAAASRWISQLDTYTKGPLTKPKNIECLPVIETRRTPTQESVVSETSPAEVKPPRHSNWSVQLGAAFILIGAAALITAGVSRPASLVPYAWLLVIAGVVASVHAFHLRRSDRFFLELVPAIASIPVALLMVTHPSAGALPWMWQFASFFTVVGPFRITAAIRIHLANRNWVVVDSIVAFLFAVMLWSGWSWLLPWFIGIAVGVWLGLRGWSEIMIAFSAQKKDTHEVQDSAPSRAPMLRHPTSRGGGIRESHNKHMGGN
jgi:uncharacterized membrane protein HdeD (DUF308 family)